MIAMVDIQAMNSESSWDFRGIQELTVSHEYNKEGYITGKANFKHLELIKKDIEKIKLIRNLIL